MPGRPGMSRLMVFAGAGTAAFLLYSATLNRDHTRQVIISARHILADIIRPEPSAVPAAVASSRVSHESASSGCGRRPPPPHGAFQTASGDVIHAGANPFSVSNLTSGPATIRFLLPSGENAMLYLEPGRTASFQVPEASYNLSLRLGAVWCGGEQDFSNERRIDIPDPIHTGKISGIDIEFDATSVSGIRISRIEREQAVPAASLPATAAIASAAPASPSDAGTVSV